MKSREFITESATELEQALASSSLTDNERMQIAGTVEQIKLHCQPFLNEIEDPFSLLRGLRPTHEWAVNRPVRLNGRNPMSTPQKLHDELNAEFTKRFGAPFRDSIFCTGSESQARVYGMVFCIFPVGDYQYLWSEKYRDLYQSFDKWRVHYNETPFLDYIDFDSYQTTGLNEAIQSGSGIKSTKGNEIMLRTKSYYGLNMNNIHSSRDAGPILNAIQDFLIS